MIVIITAIVRYGRPGRSTAREEVPVIPDNNCYRQAETTPTHSTRRRAGSSRTTATTALAEQVSSMASARPVSESAACASMATSVNDSGPVGTVERVQLDVDPG